MYDDDPILFVAGASGVAGTGGLAFTGAGTLFVTIAAITAVVLGLLFLRLAASLRRAHTSA